MLENLPVWKQLFLVFGLLVILFLAVRFNTKRNRKKRLNKRSFEERMKERQKERERKDN